MAGSSSNWYKVGFGQLKGQRVYVSKQQAFDLGGVATVKSVLSGSKLPALSVRAKIAQAATQTPPGAAKKGGALPHGLELPRAAARVATAAGVTKSGAMTPEAAGALGEKTFGTGGRTFMKAYAQKFFPTPKQAQEVISLAHAVFVANNSGEKPTVAHLAEAMQYQNLANVKKLANGQTGEHLPTYKGIQQRAKEVLDAYQSGVAPAFQKAASGQPLTPTERRKVFKYAGFANEQAIQGDVTKAKALFDDRRKIVKGVTEPSTYVAKVKGGYAIQGLNGQAIGGPIKTKSAATAEAKSYYDTLFDSNSVQYRTATRRIDKLPRPMAQKYYDAVNA